MKTEQAFFFSLRLDRVKTRQTLVYERLQTVACERSVIAGSSEDHTQFQVPPETDTRCPASTRGDKTLDPGWMGPENGRFQTIYRGRTN